MARTLTTTLEQGTSRGRNLQRGYFYFGDEADPRRPIHLFFLTEMNSLAVLDAIRVLPDGDPCKEELRDYLYGLAWFTQQEAILSPAAPGYPYRYDSAVANTETGKRGDQTGPLLVHGYEMSGDPQFLKRARALAWHVLEYQSQMRGSEIPTHVTIYTWLHRAEMGAVSLDPQVRRNDDGSFTLQWTAPEAARQYIVKYGPLPLVENLGFDQRTRTFAVDPTTALNFWAATNVSGEPAPGAAGSLETFTTPKLSAGDWHFAVKALTGRSSSLDVGETPADAEPPAAHRHQHGHAEVRPHPQTTAAESTSLPHGHDPHHLWKRPRASKSGSGER
jgi:hypothetical protein